MNFKKITITITLLSSLLLASNPYSKKEVKTKENIKTTVTRVEAEKIYSDFMEITGTSKEEFDSLLDIALKDKYWQKGTINLFFKTKEITMTDHKKEILPDKYQVKRKYKIPKWKQAIINYNKSVYYNQNILSAYMGQTIINQNFRILMERGGQKHSKDIVDNVVNKYMPTFTKLLKKAGYCYGYLYRTTYLSIYADNIERALSVGKIGKKICKRDMEEKDIPKFLEYGMRKIFVETSNTKYLREVHAKKTNY